jgi:flagellar basal-body rod modification protein FlgD
VVEGISSMVRTVGTPGSPAALRTAAANPTGPTEESVPAAPGGSLGKDAFLKLLVAQLRYQDPMNPQDSSEFLAQTAQFNMVEKLEELAQQGAELARMTGSHTAASFLGRQVSYVGADGQAATGMVSGARLTADGPQLVVGTATVPLSSVTEVRLAQ